MRAKEYLRTNQRAICYFDEINRIIYDLYEMRRDKEMTKIYYERILQSDIRFSEYEDEQEEWTKLGREYGWDGLVEPEYQTIDGEIDKYDASYIREELLKVVQDDKSFGYLFHLLSNNQDNFPNQQVIEAAIREEELNEKLYLAKKRILELEQMLKQEKEFREVSINPNLTDCRVTERSSKHSDYKIAAKRKTDFIKVVYAMNECRIFVMNDGTYVSNKQKLIKALAIFFNENIPDYSSLLSNSKNSDNFSDVFDELKKKAQAYNAEAYHENE